MGKARKFSHPYVGVARQTSCIQTKILYGAPANPKVTVIPGLPQVLGVDKPNSIRNKGYSKKNKACEEDVRRMMPTLVIDEESNIGRFVMQ